VGIHEADKDFMVGVPRCPHSIEVEPAGADVSGSDFIPGFVAVGDRFDEAIGASILALFEAGDSLIDFVFECFVAGRGISLCTCREVVAQRVSGEAHLLPTAINGSFWFELRIDAEVVEKAFGFDREKIGFGFLLRIEPGTASEFDLAEGELFKRRSFGRGLEGHG